MKELDLRDALARSLKSVPGVVSVGLSKHSGEIILMVAIDQQKFSGAVPDNFEGLRVVLKDLGRGEVFQPEVSI